MDYLLLISSVLAGGGRSLFVKGCNKSIENAAQLFFCTFLSSLIAGILIASSGTGDLMIPDRRTVLFAVLFASANIMVDICNMQAIKTGSYALSSVFLSSNFIIPSLSGAFFWNEPISGSPDYRSRFDCCGVGHCNGNQRRFDSRFCKMGIACIWLTGFWWMHRPGSKIILHVCAQCQSNVDAGNCFYH